MHAPLVPRLVRVVPTLVLMSLGVTCSANAQPQLSLPMECRQQKESWQPCRYESEQPGARWRLAFQNQTVHFRHDGTGLMQMQVGDHSAWTAVQARWIAERTLCWNDVCARGDIPLD